MHLLTQPRTGRQLMVPDDAESIARQARRRAATRRRQQDALRVVVGVGGVVSIIAMIMGVSLETIVMAAVVLGIAGYVGFRRLQDWYATQRVRRMRAQVGRGIGTPRPKGGFSTTRHRSGAPVWVDRPAA